MSDFPAALPRGRAAAAGSGRVRLLPTEDAQELLRQYARTRDVEIRNRLVRQHERMVRYLAGRFGTSSPGTSLEDLVQVGYVGLIAALDRFDPEKGVSFVTFAVPTILGE